MSPLDRGWWPYGPARDDLTAERVWSLAERVPEILGPLLGEAQPLSLNGGVLRAVDLAREPLDAWRPWLEHVTFVQTRSPDVCRALARADRTFRVPEGECVEVLRDLEVGAIEIESRELPFWRAPVGIDTRVFVPLLHLSDSLWLVWDRDLREPIALDRNGRRWTGRPSPSTVLPLVSPPHPEMAPCNAIARGEKWAAAVLATRKSVPRLFTGPGNRWGLVHSFGRDEDTAWLDELWWLWNHATLREMVQHVARGSAGASFASIELVSSTRAHIHWIGKLSVHRCRGGVFEQLTESHTLARDFASKGVSRPEFANVVTRMVGRADSELEELEVRLQPGDRLIVCDGSLDAALPLVAQGDLRRGVEAMIGVARDQQATQTGVLVVQPGATVTTPTPPRLAPILAKAKPVTQVSQRFAEPPSAWPDWRWRLSHPAHEPGGISQQPPMQWRDAMGQVHTRGGIFEQRAAEVGDVVTLQDETIEWSFRFDGSEWRACQKPTDEEALDEGPIEFSEDAISELDVLLKKLPPVAQSLHELSDAAAPAHPQRAHWLRLLAQHRMGSPTAGLRDAARTVSGSFRRRCRRFAGGPGVAAWDIDVSTLYDNPVALDRLRVRYRGGVHEMFERMWTGGGWWRPAPGTELGSGWHLAEVVGDVSYVPEGLRLIGALGKTVDISGVATPLSVVPSRTIEQANLVAQRVRRAVPLECEMWVDLGLDSVRLEGDGMMQVSSTVLPRIDHPQRARVRAVVASGPAPTILRILEVLESEPLEAKPYTPEARNDDFVILEGTLLPATSQNGQLSWPRLVDGPPPPPKMGIAWRSVVPPPFSSDPALRTRSSVEDDARMAPWKDLRPRRVRIHAEVHFATMLWATRIEVLDR